MWIKNIQKLYGDRYTILEFKKGILIEPPACIAHARVNCPDCTKRGIKNEVENSSIARTKSLITDYVIMNKFDLFTTFTFDPAKVDSYDIVECKRVMSNWLHEQRKRDRSLAYLVVAEYHKSGRLHFHALMKNFSEQLIDSNQRKSGRIIYNLANWRFGFSTAVKIDNIEKVGYYMQKYITKDMIKISNKKRFWVSRNLEKPEKLYNIDLQSVTLGKCLVDQTYENEYFTIYKSK